MRESLGRLAVLWRILLKYGVSAKKVPSVLRDKRDATRVSTLGISRERALDEGELGRNLVDKGSFEAWSPRGGEDCSQ